MDRGGWMRLARTTPVQLWLPLLPAAVALLLLGLVVLATDRIVGDELEQRASYRVEQAASLYADQTSRVLGRRAGVLDVARHIHAFASTILDRVFLLSGQLERFVIDTEGLEVLHEALASGKGVVGITSHLGNWEVLNHFYCSQCKPIIFYRPPKLKAVDELLRKQRVQLGNRVAASTKEGILSVIKEVRKGGAVGIPADPEPAESAGIFVPFFATQALTSKFVPNMLAGGKAVGVFLHALRLPDGSGYKVILEAAPDDMYSTDTETSCAAMSQVVERYVRAYPSQYMWSMKRFKKRPPGEARWY